MYLSRGIHTGRSCPVIVLADMLAGWPKKYFIIVGDERRRDPGMKALSARLDRKIAVGEDEKDRVKAKLLLIPWYQEQN